ncbi:MAG TPA: hypothetical protein VFW11_08500 [Cyclobacteriaceae bacterium]|nr:hypothetical protein [Cyclobacteriaceae bacterium]
MINPGRVVVTLGIVFVIYSCSSYTRTQQSFNKDFEQGNLKKALETLQQGEKLSRTKFIYYANTGLIFSILGKYNESNEYFEKAFLFGEDYRINYANEAASYLTNPLVTTYRGEDHEHLMVLYYKAINSLKMNKYEDALIECRRLNIRLQQLSDKYSAESKYQRDAFCHTLMGIIYQAAKDYNNAFIAYRNALEIYQDDYARLFNLAVPDQLKMDLMNTAYWSGFQEEFQMYREQFGLPAYQPQHPDAELVFFWHNGLGPVKEEWSINFVIQSKPDNWVVFRNDELGLTFPFQLDNDDDRSRLSKLEVYRVAFPKYRERQIFYTGAKLMSQDSIYNLELAEDINKIAFHSLKERMTLEFSKGLLRAALKKAAEHSIRKEDEALGAMIGIINAMTEHADTRNWQTLPHDISYSRIPLRIGQNAVDFEMTESTGKVVIHHFTYDAQQDQTLFHTFSSLESYGLSGRFY